MVKDKHEEVKAPPVPPKALAEGHSPKAAKPHSDTRTGIYDGLLPVDSVPGTEYYLTVVDGVAGELLPLAIGVPVGTPAIRVFHTTQPGQDALLSEGSGAPLGTNLQPSPDFRFAPPDSAAIKKSNEKYAENRRAHDHENASRAHK